MIGSINRICIWEFRNIMGKKNYTYWSGLHLLYFSDCYLY